MDRSIYKTYISAGLDLLMHQSIFKDEINALNTANAFWGKASPLFRSWAVDVRITMKCTRGPMLRLDTNYLMFLTNKHLKNTFK